MAADGRPMYVVPNWIERHCVIPDGFRAGEPFRLYRHQGAYLLAFYTVRANAEWDPVRPVRASAFVFRRGLEVGPQKLGKDPREASQVCLEGVGPALFAGFAGRDEGYVCRDHGCGCGWEYAYDPGEPKGMRWPTPYIQITAVSEDQTTNTWRALRPMIELGPLADVIRYAGEELIRLPAVGDARIETTTSSAPSRLGQPLTFASQGEAGLYTKRNGMISVADTQRRNLAGMGGRSSATTNAWDPAEASYAQETWELVHPKDGGRGLADILIQYLQPPAGLSFTDKRDRRKIFRIVYPEDTRREHGGHIELDAIEAEAVELIATDPPQAERYFGNRLVKGGGRAFDVERFRALAVTRRHEVPPGALIVIGGDGSKLWDHFSLIGTEVASGYQWPLGIWKPAGPGREVPMDEVEGVLGEAIETWSLWRAYLDPAYIESWVARWAGIWGKDRIIEWPTNRPRMMALATRSWDEAMRAGELSHCSIEDPLCGDFVRHVGNASRHETGYQDDAGKLWYAEKEASNSPDKIDSVPAAILSWEARNDALTAGAAEQEVWTAV